MGSEIDEILLAQSARRRRLTYLACGVVVAACTGVFLLLANGDSKPAGGGGSGTAGGARPATSAPDRSPVPAAVAPTPGGGEAVAPPPPPAPAATSASPLARAKSLYADGMERLRAAMQGTPGTEETIGAYRAALALLIESQAIYEKWLEEHPEDEERLDDEISELQQQLYWCRKTLPATAFPSTSGDPDEESDPAPASVPERRPTAPPPAVPPPAIPPPAFRPEEARARFEAVARRAFTEGRPDLVLEAGLPLLEDPRMEPHRAGIPEAMDLARSLAAFLAAARRGLEPRLGRDGTMTLRSGPAAGVLAAEGEDLVLRSAAGEKRFRIGDLSAGDLVWFAESVGGLAEAAVRRAAGAFFLLRGDREEAARQLLLARGAGANIDDFAPSIAETIAKVPELAALDAWQRVEPMLEAPGPDILQVLEHFRQSHLGTACFRAHREEVFAAYAKAAAKTAFDPASLFSVLDKFSGKTLDLAYDFEEAGQLLDYATHGEWVVESGMLQGKRGAAWLERFDLGSADLRFVLPEAREMAAGFWGADRQGRVGVNLVLRPMADGLEVSLRRNDRPFALERIPFPPGKIEVAIAKREEKYQVRINRNLVLKGTDNSRADDALSAAGVACTAGPIAVEEFSLRADLDLEWARGGGTRFAAWVRDWWVAGSFPIEKAVPRLGLAEVFWPERDAFDAAAAGPDGKPLWKFARADESTNCALDLNRCFEPNDKCVAYAAARLWCPERRPAVLELQVDDDATAWVNGEIVLREAPIGKAHRAPVKLEKGDNLLLVKVVEVNGGWWLRARLVGKNGEMLRDLLAW